MSWESWKRIFIFGFFAAVVSFFDMATAKKLVLIVIAALAIVASPKLADVLEGIT